MFLSLWLVSCSRICASSFAVWAAKLLALKSFYFSVVLTVFFCLPFCSVFFCASTSSFSVCQREGEGGGESEKGHRSRQKEKGRGRG